MLRFNGKRGRAFDLLATEYPDGRITLALGRWGGEGGKSDNQIAAQVGCSQVYVWRIHQELITSNKLPARETVKGQDGRVRPATRAPKAPPVSEVSEPRGVQANARPRVEPGVRVFVRRETRG